MSSPSELAAADLQGMRLDGRSAVVTGAARGLGRACALLLARRGAHVSCVDRADPGETVALIEEMGATATGLIADVTDTGACDRIARVTSERGTVTVLVNAAGVAGGNRNLWYLSDADWDRVIAASLTGTFKMCRAFVPGMRSARNGRIINFSSMAGKDGNPRASHYAAAKAGVIALTKSLGKELALDGILVNAVAPAVFETDMVKDVTPEQLQYMTDLIPMRRIGRPNELAQLVAFLASDQLSFSTGAVYDISGGRATY